MKDTDGDGLKDGWEVSHGLNPRNRDTDGDGLDDGKEVNGWTVEYVTPEGEHREEVTSDPKDRDEDGDGLSDYQEYLLKLNPRKDDTDEDGLNDSEEVSYGTDAKNWDTDGDKLSDYFEVKDGWNVYWYDSSGKYHSKRVYSNPRSADSDGDGLSDYDEYLMKLDPSNKDTDSDGLNDGDESYTKVYEYGKRLYFTGSYFTASTSVSMDGVKEDSILRWGVHYTYGVRSAEIVWGVRSDGEEVTGISGTYFDSVDIKNRVGIEGKNVKMDLYGKGWLEEFKVIIVENTSAKRADTDGDGLSDGYEVNVKSGYRTNPLSKDTDGDGIRDDWEIKGWSWNYNKMMKYRNNKGFHTNPVSKDTDGDGYEDGVDANPVANLVLKMEVVKYYHDSRTVFVGFKANYSYGGEEKSIEYYTEHVDTEIDNHVYYFDIPDRIGVKVYAEWAAYYTKAWWEGGGDAQEWYEFTMQKVGSIGKTWNVEGGNIQIEISEVGIKRIHTVGVYNDTTFKNGKYLYTGNFYVLYVESEASYGAIRKGMNVILVPDSIFVNSQLYKKIENNEVSYLQGSDSDKAKIGSIDRKDMGVHIADMFFFETNKSNLEELLTLLTEKNSTGKKFANYKAIVAEQANLPEDVLRAIPLQGIWNSPTGDGPKDTWGYISAAVTNAVVSVANFIYNGLVAVGNLIEHAAEIVAQFAMKLLKATQQAIQAVVEVVKKLVDAIRKWIIKTAENMLYSIMKDAYNWGLQNDKLFIGSLCSQKIFLSIAKSAYSNYNFISWVIALFNDMSESLAILLAVAHYLTTYILEFDGVYLYLGTMLIALPGIITPNDFSMVWQNAFYSLNTGDDNNEDNTISKRQAWGIAMMMLASLLFPTGFSVKAGGTVAAVGTGGTSLTISIGGLVMEFIAAGLTIYGALVIDGKAPTPDELWNQLFGGG